MVELCGCGRPKLEHKEECELCSHNTALSKINALKLRIITAPKINKCSKCGLMVSEYDIVKKEYQKYCLGDICTDCYFKYEKQEEEKRKAQKQSKEPVGLDEQLDAEVNRVQRLPYKD